MIYQMQIYLVIHYIRDQNHKLFTHSKHSYSFCF